MPGPFDPTPEAEIRRLLHDWARAVRAGDLEGIVAHCAPDVVWFDALLQVRYEGLEGYRRHWRRSLAERPGGLTLRVGETEIAAAGDVAFARCRHRFGARSADGVETAARWLSMTLCLRRREGRWLAVEEHFALPSETEENALRAASAA
ncbi:YybH family protein [Tistlia consotensis]|nr:SgcJ/EcaC family oxidoreductase [Tistlia consotensis]